MSVPIEREPDPGFRALERCCFCRAPSVTWTAIKSRTPGEQVACCKACASRASEAAVPTKSEWCEREAIAVGPCAYTGRSEYFAARERYGRAEE